MSTEQIKDDDRMHGNRGSSAVVFGIPITARQGSQDIENGEAAQNNQYSNPTVNVRLEDLQGQ